MSSQMWTDDDLSIHYPQHSGQRRGQPYSLHNSTGALPSRKKRQHARKNAAHAPSSYQNDRRTPHPQLPLPTPSPQSRGTKGRHSHHAEANSHHSPSHDQPLQNCSKFHQLRKRGNRSWRYSSGPPRTTDEYGMTNHSRMGKSRRYPTTAPARLPIDRMTGISYTGRTRRTGRRGRSRNRSDELQRQALLNCRMQSTDSVHQNFLPSPQQQNAFSPPTYNTSAFKHSFNMHQDSMQSPQWQATVHAPIADITPAFPTCSCGFSSSVQCVKFGHGYPFTNVPLTPPDPESYFLIELTSDEGDVSMPDGLAEIRSAQDVFDAYAMALLKPLREEFLTARERALLGQPIRDGLRAPPSSPEWPTLEELSNWMIGRRY